MMVISENWILINGRKEVWKSSIDELKFRLTCTTMQLLYFDYVFLLIFISYP